MASCYIDYSGLAGVAEFEVRNIRRKVIRKIGAMGCERHRKFALELG